MPCWSTRCEAPGGGSCHRHCTTTDGTLVEEAKSYREQLLLLLLGEGYGLSGELLHVPMVVDSSSNPNPLEDRDIF